MRVTAALLARYAENESATGLINVIGGGVDVFGVRFLPVEFSQPFAVQLRFAEAEGGQEFHVGMAILGPDLQEVGLPTEFPVVPTLGEFHAEGWEGVIFIAGTVGLYAKQVGPHSVSIRINGSESGSIPSRSSTPTTTKTRTSRSRREDTAPSARDVVISTERGFMADHQSPLEKRIDHADEHPRAPWTAR